VTLKGTLSIPAEEGLARYPEGLALLKNFYQAIFDSCRNILQERIERAVGVNVQDMVTDIDPVSGKSTIVIRLAEAV
jgi:uncharacterized protein YbcI